MNASDSVIHARATLDRPATTFAYDAGRRAGFDWRDGIQRLCPYSMPDLVEAFERGFDKVCFDEPNVWVRYHEAFKKGPPAFSWSGETADLEALMRQAISRDVALTPEEICEAQGIELAGPDAAH